jgi:hypothetical protein
VLETRRKDEDEEEQDGRNYTEKEIWAIDVRVVATWLNFGATALWEADQEELRRTSAATLDFERELWPQAKEKGGLSRERWAFWRERLMEFSEDAELDEEVRRSCKEAAEVVGGLLGR